MQQPIHWIEERVSVIRDEKGQKVYRFESWNAESFYIYDGSGNVAELIVRYDLANESDSRFASSDILCINEIGIPTENIEERNTQLCQKFGTLFWKGDLEYFGTNGTQEGLFLLPNYKQKNIGSLLLL